MSYKNLDFLFEDLQSGMITVDSIKTIINEISSKISIESIQPISEDSIIISNIISPTMASNGIIYGIDDEINSIFKISNESFLLIDIPKDSILASKLYDNTNPDDINVWGNLLKYYPSLISYRNIIKIKDTIIILANSIGGYTKHEGAPPRYDAIKSFYLFKINKNDFDVIKFPIDKILYGAIRKNPISQKYYISQYFQNSRYSQKKDSIYAIMELDFQNNFFSDHCNYKNIINKKTRHLVSSQAKFHFMQWR
ncbi:MAG: hypothetical protein UZ07_CHB004001464 [Chlorobi bacterium OLB7]|nr:MAG: hypothetical protein UZ07_CHB004001464 [Chlorobi bacterium OLB7]